jgi:hypothetical protein
MIALSKTVLRTTSRDPGTDPILDAMLAEALRQDVPNQSADRHRLAREFVPKRGWPVPPRDRRKWMRPLLVVIGALLATLLLGEMLEHLRPTANPPAALPTAIATLAPQATPTPQPTPLLQPIPAPRAQLVRLPPWRVGEARMVTMPDGRLVVATYRGGLPSIDMLLSRSAQPGDAYWIDDSRSLWVLTRPVGSSRLSWIDP